MDKRLVGKWYKTEMGETLNIFDEEPLRMKISFSTSGYYNCEPNCIYEKDNYYCFEINDEEYRMVYHIRYVDGFLKGYYTQYGRTTPIVYERISKTPEDGKFEYRPSPEFVPNTKMTYIDMLKKYASYDNRNSLTPYSTEYRLYEPAPEILEKYNYSKYISGYAATDDGLAFSLLNFVCDNFQHDGFSELPRGRRVEDIIAFCENNNGKINCRGLAILLASLLLMNGIKALHITCMPYEEPFADCHVVVDCFLPSGPRVMFDPTYRLYLKDAAGKYVSLQKLRKMLINNEIYYPNEEASYNGGLFNQDYHRQYMIKNTFRFSRGILHADGLDENSKRCLELVPKKYLTDKLSSQNKKEFVFNESEFWDN